jgi:mannosyltransferase
VITNSSGDEVDLRFSAMIGDRSAVGTLTRTASSALPAAIGGGQAGDRFSLHLMSWLLAGLHAVLLAYGLGSHGLWLDEVMSVTAATAPWPALWGFFKALPEQHPLYYLLLRPWLGLLGTSEPALRSLSAVFGVLSIPAAARLVDYLTSDRRAALLAAALLAVSPFWLYYGLEGRMYTLLVFAVIISTDCWLRILDNEVPSRWQIVAYVFSGAVGVYTHFFFCFVVFAHLCVLFAEQGLSRRSFRLAVQGPAIVAMLYFPWAILLLVEFPAGQGWKDWRHAVFGFPYTFIRFTVGYAQFVGDYGWQSRVLELLRSNAAILSASSVGFGSAILAAIFTSRHRKSTGFVRTTILLVLPVGVPLLLSPIMILSGERYFMVVFPVFLAMTASGLLALLSRPGISRWVGALSAVLIAVVTGVGSYALYFDGSFGKEQWREIAADVTRLPEPAPTVVVFPGFAASSLRYYAHRIDTTAVVLEWERLETSGVDSLWVTVSHLHTPEEAVQSLSPEFDLVDQRLYRQGVGIHLLRFVRRSDPDVSLISTSNVSLFSSAAAGLPSYP